MKIFIDFDDVIFHAKKFRRDLIGVFRKHGITNQEYENSYYSFKINSKRPGDYYDPKKQIKLLKKRFSIDNAALTKDIDIFLSDLSKYIFPDVYDFLQLFSKNDLFLITYGHPSFQRKKIRNSGIKKYFNKVIVCTGKKINTINEICDEYGISQLTEDVLLIDDHPEQIEMAEKEKMIRTFHMCRREGRYSDLLCIDKDWEVKNLNEVLKIIKQEKFR